MLKKPDILRILVRALFPVISGKIKMKFSVEFKNPNFARVAEAMGAKGVRLEDPGDVKNALAEALSYKDGPVVLDAVVDPFALSLPLSRDKER